MTFFISMNHHSVRRPLLLLHRFVQLLALASLLGGTVILAAQDKAADAAPDTLVLSNGDTLHGKLVSAIQGKVTFHNDSLGDLTLDWDKIKELHTAQKFAIIDKNVKEHGKKTVGAIPVGTLEVENKSVAVHPENTAATAPIPVGDAQFILDEATIDKQLHHEPGLLAGWSGAATAGAAVVTATENQYTFSGGVGLVRVVPTASWLNPRDRTSIGFTGSFGKITQPAYLNAGVLVPAVVSKSAIYHAEVERDEYFSPRFFGLAQTAFDHNYGQDL